MLQKTEKDRILILGGSGFIGHSLYRELQSFFDVHATYCSQSRTFLENQVFHQFDMTKESVMPILNFVQPSVIIGALKGNIQGEPEVYREVSEYISQHPGSRLLFISSAEVFDAKFTHPNYENDIPLSTTAEGKCKITIEKLLLKKIPHKVAILRLPLILGINSQEIFHLCQCIRHQAAFEVFPNLVISANTIDKICLQIHYIINQSLTGIYHLSSNDMIHHDELFKEITQKLSSDSPVFKNVYTSNDDRYKAILPRFNRLPKSFEITIDEVIKASSLNEEIVTID